VARTEREYGTEEAFEFERERMARKGGWTVRARKRKPRNFWPIDSVVFLLGDNLGCTIVGIVVLLPILTVVWMIGGLRKRQRFIVEYEREDSVGQS